MPFAERSILYVDDDEGARLMVTLLFGQEGYEVLAVGSSQASQFIVPGESFDLYILGPRLSGTQSATFCRKIREVERHAPIVIYSGTKGESEHKAALRAGCSVFVAEPSIDNLLNTVRAELEF